MPPGAASAIAPSPIAPRPQPAVVGASAGDFARALAENTSEADLTSSSDGVVSGAAPASHGVAGLVAVSLREPADKTADDEVGGTVADPAAAGAAPTAAQIAAQGLAPAPGQGAAAVEPPTETPSPPSVGVDGPGSTPSRPRPSLAAAPGRQGVVAIVGKVVAEPDGEASAAAPEQPYPAQPAPAKTPLEIARPAALPPAGTAAVAPPASPSGPDGAPAASATSSASVSAVVSALGAASPGADPGGDRDDGAPSGGAGQHAAPPADAEAPASAPTGFDATTASRPSAAAAAPSPQQAVAAALAANLAPQLSAAGASRRTRFDVTLEEGDLGRIDVRLDIAQDGRVATRLVVDRPETLALLRNDAGDLARSLAEAGFQLAGGGLSFSLRDGGRDTSPGGAANTAAGLPDDGAAPIDLPSPYRIAGRLASALDRRV